METARLLPFAELEGVIGKAMARVGLGGIDRFVIGARAKITGAKRESQEKRGAQCG
jgi:hypothetical protein